MMRKLVAEGIGTFWLTFAGCGSAVLAAGFPEVGIGLLGVSLAFGLTVVTMAYSVGHIYLLAIYAKLQRFTPLRSTSSHCR